jgi:hypothetical protein
MFRQLETGYQPSRRHAGINILIWSLILALATLQFLRGKRDAFQGVMGGLAVDGVLINARAYRGTSKPT